MPISRFSVVLLTLASLSCLLFSCHRENSSFSSHEEGDRYFYGTDVPQDYIKAVRFYSEAAERGNANAAYQLGICYYRALGVRRDYQKAVSYMKTAAEAGLPAAQSTLARLYTYGWGVPSDRKKAVEYIKKAANRNYPLAMYRLGVAYQYGLGVEQDSSLATYWFNKCAAVYQHQFDPSGLTSNVYTDDPKNLFTYARVNLVLHDNNIEEPYCRKWFDRAIMSLRRAHQRGDAESTYCLALCYENGWGTRRNVHRSVELIHEAAIRGFPMAQFRMGFLAREGLNGVEQNDSVAMSWFLQATRNDSLARYWYRHFPVEE